MECKLSALQILSIFIGLGIYFVLFSVAMNIKILQKKISEVIEIFKKKK